MFGLEHGWDISAVAPSTYSLDCHSHLDALRRVMFSEMITETFTCFGVKPDLGQAVPELVLRPDATSAPGVSWQIPMVVQNPHTHSWVLSFCPALPPAPCQGPHPAPDRTGIWVKLHCALMSTPEASVLLLHSSEIRNRFSLLWVSNRDFSLLGFHWHTLICTLQRLREVMGL